MNDRSGPPAAAAPPTPTEPTAAQSPTPALPSPALPLGLREAHLGVDRATETVQLRVFLRLLIGAALLFGTAEIVAAIVFRSAPVAVTGAALGGYGIWLLWLAHRMERTPLARIVSQVAVGLLLVISITALMQPTGAVVLVVAALLTVVIALPYLTEASLKRVMAASWAVAVLVVAVAEFAPTASHIPPWLTAILRLSGVAAGVGLVLVATWQSGRRLKEAASELEALVAMSSEVSQTLDSREIGNLMARHLAEAVGVEECAICYWDEPRDRVLTYGYFPIERRAAVAEEYELRDYPQTRRVLLEQVDAIVEVGDPNSDPSEVAYLESIGQRAMAMLPLLAKGRSIGVVELTSKRPVRFDKRRLALGRALAAEAAIALENALLYSELRVQAFYDALTRLPNRALFRDRLEHALARVSREGDRELAVLFLDLDDFKTVNDSRGHAFGDQVLASLGHRLETCLRPGDTAARLGGDEFAVLVEDVTDPRDVERLGERLIEAISAPLELSGTETTVSASVGIARAGRAGRTADELLRNADFAMYRAKALGKGRLVMFEPGQRETAVERARTEAELRIAVETNRLRLHYQPIVELATGRIVAVEALLRWEPRDGVVRMPAEFISLAEETGLIVPFGRWVMAEACRQTREWQAHLGRPDFGVSVNLSARQFQHPELVADVAAALHESGLEASALTLEITESILMQNTEPTIAKLRELRAIGLHLAIDDFGTGYSSLSYLQLFPVDTLKVDKSFLGGLAATGEGPVLGRAIIQLGHALHLQIVAEGVETPDQVGPLVELECQYGQGYLFAAPAPASEIQPLLNVPMELPSAPRRTRAAALRVPGGHSLGRRVRRPAVAGELAARTASRPSAR